MRLVKVGVWELTDQELDELAAEREATEPDYAAELRRLNDYRLKGGRLLARLKVAAAFRAAVVHRRRTAPR